MALTLHPKAAKEVPGLQVKTLTDERLIQKIKVMDKFIFPVSFNDKYYNALVTNGFHKFNALAFYHDMLVGSCTCRREKLEGDEAAATVNGGDRLYVMTIGVLEAYRRLGIGVKLMQRVIDAVANETSEKICDVSLHVQVGSPAFEFYKSFGFEVIKEEKGYYTKLEVNDALLLRKVIPQPKLKPPVSEKQKK